MQCGQEERVTVDCRSSQALRNEVFEVNAGLPQIGLGFQGKYESQALQQVRESTEHLAINLESLCRDYNACALDQHSYLEETRRIRERLSNHLQLAEQQRQSRLPELGDKLWSNARPDLAHSRLSLTYRLEVATGSGYRVHRSGEALTTGDEVRFVLEANQAGFVYVLLLSSQGTPALLFPLPEHGLDNPVPAGRAIIAPPPERVRLQLDAVTGVEHLQIIASTSPLNDLSQRMAALQPGARGDKPVGAELLNQVGQLLCATASEPAKVEATLSSVKCNGRPNRGLIFVAPPSGAAASSSGIVLAAQPNDGVVVYQHEIVHR